MGFFIGDFFISKIKSPPVFSGGYHNLINPHQNDGGNFYLHFAIIADFFLAAAFL